MTIMAEADGAMSARSDTGTGVEKRDGATSAVTVATRGLQFAAAPTFAAMALLSAASGHAGAICLSGPDASPLTGMAAMYALMSAFHAAPWLRLLSGR